MMARFALLASLALLAALQALCLWRAPAVWQPSAISVTLKPGESMVLGRHELAAPQAAERHLVLGRGADGRWSIRRFGNEHALLVQRDGHDIGVGNVVLKTGQDFHAGRASFHVERADASALTFSSGQRRWRYDGSSVSPQLPCPDAHLAARWNRLMPGLLGFARPVVFGGSLHCDNRLGGMAPGSATIARANGQFILAGDGIGEEPLAGASAVIAGHTRLDLTIDADTIVLRPSRHVALFSAAQVALPPQVRWQMTPRQLWSVAPASAWWIGLAMAVALGLARLRCKLQLAPCLLAVGGLTLSLLQRGGTAPGIAIYLLLEWATLAYLVRARLSLALAAAVLLLAAGLLAQLELGLGGLESSWLRHFQKSVALLAMGVGLLFQLRPGTVSPTRMEWLLAGVAALALLALALQVALGSETGVFDVQPVEFAKVALTALAAHCLAIGIGWHRRHDARRWLRLAAPALLFAALLGVALVQVDDFSPLILLAVWSVAMALAYALAARKWLLGGAVATLGLLVAIGIGYLHGGGVLQIAQWGFYADRFMVWIDPARHPHTGQQLLLGAHAIGAGGWFGSDQWLGLASLGQEAGAVMHVPQVQDDFAASFFLNRHGLAGALALWALQALFLAGLLQGAARALAASGAARDFRHAWQGRFHCFVLCGGAAFVFGHFLLSWGTNLAILPIMGQPMSFLSAGGSHLLFFICPLLAFCAISAQSFEEKPSCQSMSSTK
ncbi:MAG: FtsW/RodA/SpoVE family cell cycle protein [Pseudomonadota bacterium]